MEHYSIPYFNLENWLNIAERCFTPKQSTDDLINRCLLLASASINSSDIVIFDGHGRTLYFLISFLRKLAPNRTFTIHVPDIDPYSYKWHELFFPYDENITIKNYCGDFFTFSFPKKSVVYLNFCGIGKSTKALEKYIENYKYGNNVTTLFLSFCARKNRDFAEKMRLKGEIVSERSNFKTFKFVKDL